MLRFWLTFLQRSVIKGAFFDIRIVGGLPVENTSVRNEAKVNLSLSGN